MTPDCVVDCSMAAAFYLGEPDGGRFGDIVKQIRGGGGDLRVPCLFAIEIMNTVLSATRRKRISEEHAGFIRRDVYETPFVTESALTDKQMEAVFALAARYELTFYDATYLELALRLGAPLKTLDRDLLNLRDQLPCISDR